MTIHLYEDIEVRAGVIWPILLSCFMADLQFLYLKYGHDSGQGILIFRRPGFRFGTVVLSSSMVSMLENLIVEKGGLECCGCLNSVAT